MDDPPDSGMTTPDSATDTGETNPSESPTAGGDCSSNVECGADEICVGANPGAGVEGYCTILDCQTSDDCAFARGGTFCCSSYGQTRGCFREQQGASCGQESGTQGDACVDGGQSDCEGDAGFFCVALYGPETAQCMRYCVPGGRCPLGTGCLQTAPNAGVCAPTGEAQDLESCEDDPFVCDCLLYTSPSPRDKRQSRMPSSA